MSEPIREVLLDLPLVQTDDRPQGMIVMRRDDVPEDRREEADEWVASHGGQIGEKPIFEVIGGTTPASAPGSAAFYALPPAAFVAE